MFDAHSLPRITVAAVVEHHGRFLFVEEESDGQRVLNQPAGHLDPGESLLQAVVRETMEESAWEVEPVALLGIYQYRSPRAEYLRFAFECRALRHHPERALDREIVAAHWLSRAELLAARTPLRSPMVVRCVDDHALPRRFPLDLVLQL